jgi:hypothetical protein
MIPAFLLAIAVAITASLSGGGSAAADSVTGVGHVVPASTSGGSPI